MRSKNFGRFLLVVCSHEEHYRLLLQAPLHQHTPPPITIRHHPTAPITTTQPHPSPKRHPSKGDEKLATHHRVRKT
jgi:hypothetical protein